MGPHAHAFRDKVTDLAAPIHGKSKYALASDDVREQRRFRRLRRAAISALVVLTVAAVTAAVVAFIKQHEATQQRQRAERERDQAVALKLTSQSESMLAGVQRGGDLRALQQLVVAQRIAQTLDDSPLLRESEKL